MLENLDTPRLRRIDALPPHVEELDASTIQADVQLLTPLETEDDTALLRASQPNG